MLGQLLDQLHDQLPDRLLLWTLRASATIAAAIVLLIAAFVVLESLPALRGVGLARFFTDASWHPASSCSPASPPSSTASGVWSC